LSELIVFWLCVRIDFPRESEPDWGGVRLIDMEGREGAGEERLEEEEEEIEVLMIGSDLIEEYIS
jgi:hypothetical protein